MASRGGEEVFFSSVPTLLKAQNGCDILVAKKAAKWTKDFSLLLGSKTHKQWAECSEVLCMRPVKRESQQGRLPS